jgi:GNAT superfamily N-acetyltransferase
LHPDVLLHDRLPTLDEYRDLCTAVGWAPVINFDAAPASLARSLLGVVAVVDGRTVGMGRVVGDVAIYHYVQDVVVHPDQQHRGIGDAIVGRLVAQVRARAPERAFIGVFAATGSAPFYERHGFVVHEALTGMFQVVQGRATTGPDARTCARLRCRADRTGILQGYVKPWRNL